MRVTMNTIFDQITSNLSRLANRMEGTNASISSGKIYRRPSDEPVALAHALGIRADLSENSQFQRNITYGKGWAGVTESVLSQVQDRLLRAKELAVQGANDSLSDVDRRAIAAEVRGILEEVVALGNTKLGGRYVFGGTKTQGYGPGEAPFVMESAGNVSYLGNRASLSIKTAPGFTQTISLNGEETFIQGGVFQALDLLADGLSADSQPDVETALGNLDKAIGHISDRTAVVGAARNALDNKGDMADSIDITSQERLSDIEDTDMIEAMADLSTQETAYKAALASASKVMSLSLVDYL